MGIVPVGMHLGEMPGIVLAGMSVAVRPEIPEGTGLVVGMPALDLEETRREIRGEAVRVELLEGIGLRGMWEGPDLQPTTRGLRGILMQDFRREAVGHKRNHGHSPKRNHGHNRSLSSDLSQDRRRRVHDRVGLPGITMPEQRGRRAIAVEPVLAAVETEEVDSNETSHS